MSVLVSLPTRLPKEIAEKCRGATTLKEAASAASEAKIRHIAYAHQYLESGQYIDATRSIANAAAWIDSVYPHVTIDVWIDAVEDADGTR